MIKSVEVKLFFIAILFVLVGCSQPEDTEQLKQEVIETDANFSKMAAEKGVAEAFIYFADEKVIKPAEGKQPIVGKFALIESYKNNAPISYTLSWKPLRAEASGNLGYTFGGYTLNTKTVSGQDTTVYGNYISVWKRKRDGSWRYVIDTGNSTPGPVVLK